MSKENLFMKDCIRTVSGEYVNIVEPNPSTIRIDDIAHSLSMQHRFGGHIKVPYTVAQHCVFVASLVPLEMRLQALLHDAPEAYLLDIPTPIKAHLPQYQELEANLMNVIAHKFGIELPIPEQVKAADKLALQIEWDTLVVKKIRSCMINVWSKKEAENAFIETYVYHCNKF